MSSKHVDVTIHVDENLTEPEQQDLVGQLLANNGVLDVRHDMSHPHLFVTDYDPDEITSTELLEVITGSHLHGQVFGF